MSEMIKKISAKNVMETRIKPPEEATELFKVFGIARGTRSGEGDNGPWTSLIGGFEAIRTHDGKVFKAPQVFLPEPVNSLMAEKLREESVNELQFAVVVGLKPSDTPIGYEYTCSTIVDADDADPLAALRDQVFKALEAPKETAKGTGKGKAA